MIIGVLGAGQLGRMLALAGLPLGAEFRFLDPNADAPAGRLAALDVCDWIDTVGLARLAQCDVVTYEFESVPIDAARFLAQRTRVYPPPEALRIAQDRLLEKTCFTELGIPTPAFRAVSSLDELRGAVSELGLPAVLKTRTLGYDGKGQSVLRQAADLEAAFQKLAGRQLILEAFVTFERELSVLAVRAASGETAFYPLVENQHDRGVLRLSRVPATPAGSALERAAQGHAARLLDHLGYVGVLALELFDAGGTLLASEIAPRVHNSGHWTIEGAVTSQFENHVRAITGLPLGSTQLLRPCAMLNAVGERPDAQAVLALPDVHLHDYGKEPRKGRKLGHVTLRAASSDELSARLLQVEPLVPFVL